MNKTKISWTDVTWNPVHGCSKVSDGCKHCYAEALSLRFGQTKKPWTHQNAAENITLRHHKVGYPYRLKKPSRIFVNSMSDLFHELVPPYFIGDVFAVMNDCPQHQFQILTKRPERTDLAPAGVLPHVWIGTSIEDRRTLHRLDTLRTIHPSPVLFLSFEPLLEDLGTIDLDGISWVIVGGESGAGWRSMDHAWARSIRDQCVDQGVAFFFKQSASFRNEQDTALEEEDGSKWIWHQMPDQQEYQQPQEVRHAGLDV